MILEKQPSSKIRKAAREKGTHFLRQSALAKVKAGATTLKKMKEINKVTFIETTR